MKTNDLIDLLATGAGPAPRWAEARRLLPMMALGVVASAAGALAIFGPIPAELFATPAPWIKFVYAGGLAAAAAWLAARLGRPVPRTRAPLRALLLVLMAMGRCWLWGPYRSARRESAWRWSLAIPGPAAPSTCSPCRCRPWSVRFGPCVGWLPHDQGPPAWRLACWPALSAHSATAYPAPSCHRPSSPSGTASVSVWRASLGAVLGPRVLRW